MAGVFEELEQSAHWADAKAKLIAGTPPKRVAQFLHVHGEFQHYTVEQLAVRLAAYRRQQPLLDKLANEDPAKAKSLVKLADGAINELHEIADLYSVQKARVLSMRSKEIESGVIDKNIGNEVRIAGEIIRTSLTIKQSLGITKEVNINVASEVGARARDIYGDKVAEVMEDPKSRSRVISAVESILTAAKAKSGK